MSILEILEAHYVSTTRENRVVCKTCGILTEEILLGGEQSYRLGITHQAQVLEQHEREANAEALEEYADAIQHVDDVIQRGADADDRWCDFQDAEREFNRNDGDQVRDYYSATTHYARYRAAQIRSRS